MDRLLAALQLLDKALGKQEAAMEAGAAAAAEGAEGAAAAAAAAAAEGAAAGGGALRVVAVITGKGPLKAEYEERTRKP